MRPLVAGGVSRFGLTAAAPHAGLASLIDHTLLNPEATEGQTRQLCSEAAEFGFATVCVQSTRVRLSAETLQDAGFGLCTVAGFPLGANTPDVTPVPETPGAPSISWISHFADTLRREVPRR